jgi:protocatechuate 3,4-dioxygenase beta subunit
MSNHPSYARRRLLAGSVALCALPFGRVFAGEVCPGSVTNILGPAYRKGAPFRSQLCQPDEPGTPLTMSGRVADAATCKPLPGAVLDIWQVDSKGDYDWNTDAFHMRGKFKAGDDGRYVFDTILPVPYGRRPKHIHYLVTCAGYEPHITQCYFDGDERNATDPHVKKELVIEPAARADAGDRHGVLAGTFHVALQREQPAGKSTPAVYRDYPGDYELAPGVVVTVTTSGRHLHWHVKGIDDGEAEDGDFVPRSQNRFFVPEYDVEITFVRNEHGLVDHQLDSHGKLFKRIRAG